MHGMTKRELCAQPSGVWNAQDAVEVLIAMMSLALNNSLFFTNYHCLIDNRFLGRISLCLVWTNITVWLYSCAGVHRDTFSSLLLLASYISSSFMRPNTRNTGICYDTVHHKTNLHLERLEYLRDDDNWLSLHWCGEHYRVDPANEALIRVRGSVNRMKIEKDSAHLWLKQASVKADAWLLMAIAQPEPDWHVWLEREWCTSLIFFITFFVDLTR